MAEITSALVKQLREQSGAGMMDCKRALVENDGDIEVATDWLRKKGLAAAAKKAGRVAAEGLVGMSSTGLKGALAEINAETDFVARNETFQQLVAAVAALAPRADGDVEKLKAMPMEPSGETVEAAVANAVAVIGENITLRRTAVVEVPEGLVAGYVHNQVAPGMGKIGVLVGLKSAAPAEALAELGKQLAMHVAATNPHSLDVASLDPAIVERERAVYADQARASGKPDNIIEKMVDGRMRKFYEESVLIEQVFVVDPDKRVKQAVEALAKELGTAIEVTGFVRMACGEGIEKEQADLAAEVAKMTQA